MDKLQEARKVLALRRQRKSFLAAVKAGDLTDEQAAALVADVDRQLKEIAAQQSLELGDGGAKAPPVASKSK